MRDEIVFYLTEDGYYSFVSHGGSSAIPAKLDTGSSVTVFNLNALVKLIGADAQTLNENILNSKTPKHDFFGYNGYPSELYLCSISNIVLDKYPTYCQCFQIRKKSLTNIFL